MVDLQAMPDIELGPLSILAIGRRSVPTPDPWWVDDVSCRIVVASGGVSVDLAGHIPSRNFRSFLAELATLNVNLQGTATLDGSDMGAVVSLWPDSLGHVDLEVRVLPGGIWASPLVAEFRTDQTFLPQMLVQCRRVLDRFPVLIDQGRT